MGIFDPKADTSVAYEQPVQQPQSMGLALANVGTDIAGGILRAKVSGQGGGQGEDYSDEWAMAQFQTDLQKANAARAEGKKALADRIESTALLNAQRNGLAYNKDLEATYSALTGRPGEELLFSEEEIMENRIMETPEYEAAFTSTYATDPDVSSEKRHQLAMSQVARQQGQASIMLDQSIQWTQGKRDAFFSAVDDFENAALGTLNQMAQKNGFADLQSIRQARAVWEQTKSGFLSMRPEGVKAEQWKQFEARMSQVDAVFDNLEEISTEEGVSALAASELARGIQNKEDWTPGMKLIAKQYFKDGLATGAIAPTEVREMVGSLIYEDFEPSNGQPTGFDPDGNPVEEPLPKSVTDTLSGEDAEASFDRAKNITKLTGSGDTSKVTTDPTYRNDFFKTTQVAFAAMSKIGKENRRFVSADGISEVFNGQIVEGLRKAGTTDPVKARATAEMGFNALDNQFAIASTQLSNSLQGTILRLDPQGNLVLNREEILSRTTPEMFNQIEQAANDFYGGNVLALLKDRGMKARMVPVEGGGFRQATAVNLPSEVYEGLGDLETIRGQLRSVKAIKNKRDEFRVLRDEFTEEADNNLEGSQGGDTLRSLDYEGNTLDLIKEFEGFRETPYWDVNAFRVGYGSDTITKPDGTVVQVREGMSVSREDAERDLRRRTQEFATGAKRQVGSEVWTSYPSNVRAALTSIAYNYGSLPERILEEARSGDVNALASAVEGLAGDNDGVNRDRRLKEAAIIRGGPMDENGQLVYTPRPVGRPQTRRNQAGGAASVDIPDVDTPELSGGGGGSIEGVDAQTASVEATSTSQEASRSAEEDKESASKINEQQRNRVLRILKAQGVDTDVIAKFDSMEAAQEAINNGTLSDGDLYEVNGEIEVVEKA